MLDGRGIERDVHRSRVSTINLRGKMKPSLEDHGIQQQKEPSGSCNPVFLEVGPTSCLRRVKTLCVTVH